MKNKILALLYVFVILLCARQCLNYFYNKYVLSFYADKDYSINEDLLLTANFFEPYIVHYNNANILYQNCLYKDALTEYETARAFAYVPDDRECDIRTNMALCYVAQLDDDYSNPDNIEESLNLLYQGRDILLENEKNNDEDAKTLLKDIEDLIEELENIQDEQQEETTDPTDPSNPTESSESSTNSTDTSQPSQPNDSSQESTSEDPNQSNPESSTSGTNPSEGTSNTSESSDTGESSTETGVVRPSVNPTDDAEQTGTGATTNFSAFMSSVHDDLQAASQSASSQRVDDLRDYDQSQNGYTQGGGGIW